MNHFYQNNNNNESLDLSHVNIVIFCLVIMMPPKLRKEKNDKHKYNKM